MSALFGKWKLKNRYDFNLRGSKDFKKAQVEEQTSYKGSIVAKNEKESSVGPWLTFWFQ